MPTQIQLKTVKMVVIGPESAVHGQPGALLDRSLDVGVGNGLQHTTNAAKGTKGEKEADHKSREGGRRQGDKMTQQRTSAKAADGEKTRRRKRCGIGYQACELGSSGY